MPKTLSIAAALGLTLALAAPAAAQDRGEREMAPDVNYDFDDDDVEGTYRSPLGESLVVRTGAGHTSLIRPRAHFVPEMLKSVERL